VVRICTPQARGIDRRRALRRNALVLAAFTVVFSVMAAVPVARVEAIFGRSGLSFAVVGDSQGRNEVWGKAVDAINAARPQFLLHCGDMVASGTSQQYDEFLTRARRLRMPLYTVLGNHDVKGDGRATYARLIRKDAYYSFVQKGYKFIGLDSSSGALDVAQIDWLRRELATSGPKFVFMHVPLFDPRPGGDHCFLDLKQAAELHRMFSASRVLAVFSGHVHVFARQEMDGVTYVTTGGGGALLYARAEQGGFHHFAMVRVDGDQVQVEAVPVKAEIEEPRFTVRGPKGQVEMTLGEIAAMPRSEVETAFENRFGNLGGQGVYAGVRIAALVDMVGGMSPGQVLVVTSSDGYAQEFAYENVYPSAKWSSIQGEMLLAYEKDGATHPAWGECPRIVFAPADGVYHNSDCAATSAAGQGWNVYESAGARWARYVTWIDVR
jgi:predicted phosphodiesterase